MPQIPHLWHSSSTADHEMTVPSPIRLTLCDLFVRISFLDTIENHMHYSTHTVNGLRVMLVPNSQINSTTIQVMVKA